jgi:hypothetical protein
LVPHPGGRAAAAIKKLCQLHLSVERTTYNRWSYTTTGVVALMTKCPSQDFNHLLREELGLLHKGVTIPCEWVISP